MAKIGFLGLGEMGTPMARRLRRAGHDMVVWNRSPERTVPLVQEGAAVAPSPAKAVTGSDFVITMLATPEALEQVLFGTGGLAPALSRGQVLIDMSTVGPDEISSVAARLPQGASLVDAPVRGSVPQAESGRLEVFVGATDEDYARVRPILESFGSVRHTGGPGSGAAMKLVANLALGAAIVTLGEALALGESLELKRDVLLDTLMGSPIGPIVNAKRANVESGRFAPSFRLRHAAKDLRLVMEAAAARGRDLKQARANRAWLDEAAERGAADLDFSAVVATIRGEDR
ncbi:MAG TPA: NAD(P)-dependent oxidoreductase [Vicinamibacterales bacterium]|nr:NAD(P)-dependent oxidoreductase [Vicinamibacterales bacterium]